MQKIHAFLMIAVISLITIASYAIKISVAEGYPGLISAPNKKSGQEKNSGESKGGGFSFISPTIQNKNSQQKQKSQQQQSQQQNPQATTNPQFQGYQNYDSYESYYKAQAEQQAQPIMQPMPIPSTPSSPLVNPAEVQTPEVTLSDIVMPKINPINEEQKYLLSISNARTTEGLPKTANIRRKILNTLEMLEDDKLSKSQKKELLQTDINELEMFKKGISLEKEHGDNIYKNLNLPDSYIAQLKQDNIEALELIEQALNRFYKY